ncbi:MAG: siderophore ABC transporter substrate-binding protein [Clostridium argentinense]|uniref:Siderophore ABC transporter substrate-binding protein n=1 Tax=Clostridium faecium TaxID=2762223 RepID=A0ABR8YV01_9CLOT|nr:MULTISPECIES: siderophore ABC transporter substrate-binding protein [Clostridium]MBD8047813.1 siderophore ABC transporter substrate-binding protein [Clostridium faecium]MBS5822852.1 siderophore ABC transporter substrate-binding protein [Clostridium argentinense]MDU1349719.1 siderophore ABC transporter substrate-binding protein [Clostridium argentinense]
MNKKVTMIAGILVLAVIAAFGFSKLKGTDSPQGGQLKIAHELGEAEVNKNPKKVVAFDYGIIDSLDKMGVEIEALPKSNLPASLEKYKDEKYLDAGTLFEPDFEKINEIKPDVIFISGRQSKVYEELNKIAPTIYLSIDDKDYMGSFAKNMNTLGEIFNKESFVEKELKNINKAAEELSEKASKSGKNALVTLANDGSLSAYGPESRFGVIHKGFGFTPVDENIDNSNHGQKISFEYIVEKDPDYIFVVDRGAIVGGKTSANQVFENDLIKNTKAYKEKNIIYLDPQIWYISTGGFNSTMKMIEEVGSAIK